VNALKILQARGVEFDTVEYMKAKPTRETLTELVDKLDGPVADLVRKDSVFAKLGLNEADYVTPAAVVEVLVKHPKLLQRPVVMTDSGAVIGRPKERVTELLDRSS
jgi:arsenate reductase (glutaredoxin)